MKKVALFFTLLVLATSCSKFIRVQRNPDVEARYEAAMKYYEEEDYYRANLLFEDLIPNIMGSAKAEEVQFRYAYTHFHQNSFLLSSHYFKSFFDTYRRSSYAEEALYMHAYSLYLNTPSYNLDQSNTNDAVTALQDFINRFPNSGYATDASKHILTLRQKLEDKSFDIAKQYAKLRRYKAAVIAFENFQKDFPDSKKREEAAYMKIKAQYELAKISIYTLKAERYNQAIEDYLYYLDRYYDNGEDEDSDLLKSAQSIYKSCLKDLESL